MAALVSKCENCGIIFPKQKRACPLCFGEVVPPARCMWCKNQREIALIRPYVLTIWNFPESGNPGYSSFALGWYDEGCYKTLTNLIVTGQAGELTAINPIKIDAWPPLKPKPAPILKIIK